MNILCSALTRLLENDGSLMASAFTPKQRAELELFSRNTRLITICKQGRSVIFQITHWDRVIDYLKAQQPIADEELPTTLPARSKNIGKQRNSKKGQTGHDACYLLMKAWDYETTWKDNVTVMHPAKQTEQYGLAAIKISAGNQWQTDQALLLVENQALFDRCDWLSADFSGSVAYYAGQLPELLLNWLAESKRASKVILFPDYDGIGLANYARLARKLHAESVLQFYWLPDWEKKLILFGNSELWLKTRKQFENAIAQLRAGDALTEEIILLSQLCQSNGKALEQEAIWL